MSEQTLKDVIDTYQGKNPALRDSQEFQAVRDQMAEDFLAFSYVDPGQLAENDPELSDSAEDFGLLSGDAPFAGVVTASDDVFSFEHAFPEAGGELATVLAPRVPSFASRVPEHTSLFVSTAGLASLAPGDNEPASPDPTGEDGGDGEIEFEAGEGDIDFEEEDFVLGFADLGWLFAGAPFRLGEMRELSELFTGEMAVASWDASGDSEAGSVLLAEVDDPERARTLAIDLASGEADVDSRSVMDIGGNEVTVVGDGAVAVVEGVLIAGSMEGVRLVIEGPEQPLSESPAFLRASQRLGTPLGSFVFLNVAGIFSAGLVDPDDPAALALESIIFNGVNDAGLTRFAAIVLATEE
jgi:hypothetical protein